MRRIIAVFGALMTAIVVTPSANVAAQADSALEKNKVLAQRFHLDMIEKGNLQIADEIIAADCVIHLPNATSDLRGPERARQVANGDLKAFPKGIRLTHDVVFGERNMVAFHWTLVGTRESGEETTFEGIDLVRTANGKIAEMWIEYHTVKK